jgi:hypothetical protein
LKIEEKKEFKIFIENILFENFRCWRLRYLFTYCGKTAQKITGSTFAVSAFFL